MGPSHSRFKKVPNIHPCWQHDRKHSVVLLNFHALLLVRNKPCSCFFLPLWKYPLMSWHTITQIHANCLTGSKGSNQGWYMLIKQGGSRGGDWGDRPPKTYESNFFHHNFVQFGKQHSRYKVILSSIVLSQMCCEVNLISLTAAKPLLGLTINYY